MRELTKVLSLFLFLLFFTGCKEKVHVRLTEVPVSKQAQFSHRKGPLGEKAYNLRDLKTLLRDVSSKDVAAKKYSIAIAMHDVHNDWSQALLTGLQETTQKFGINVSLITDGEFNVDKQIADIENIIRLKPDLLITLPLDAKRLLPVLKKVAQAHIKLVFIDAVPENFPPEDYVGWAVGDGYRMGELSAEALVESLDSGSEVAMLCWKNKMFTVDERTAGAKAYLSSSESVRIVDTCYFSDFHEIPDIIDTLLFSNPDLKGLWAVWDTPALEAINAIKKHNRLIKVATCDLSKGVANELINGAYIVGIGVDHPYKQGEAEALLAIAALEKIQIPSYIVLPAQKVTRSNLSSSWNNIFHKNLPTELKEKLN